MAISKITSDAIDATGFNLDSNTLTVDATNNRVGISTNSPSAPLEVSRSDAGIIQYITNTGSAQAYTAYGNSDNPPWSQDFNTAGGLLVGIDSDETGVVFQGGNKALRFGTNASERMRILAGGGLTFNGDTAAANALDDYEEGSWTPDIRRNDGTVSATFTVGTGTATYVKIGRVVHLKCWLHTISNGSSNGSSYWRVNGLPFTGTQYSGSASGYNSLTPNSLYIGDAGGNIILTSDTTPYTGSLLGTIMINITYETNS